MSHEQTTVVLENDTSKDWLSAGVIHKYSDNYKDKQDWGKIKKGDTTPPFTVNYNVGAFTTGQDWWSVSWIDDKGHMFITDPNNFRNIVDFLEKITGPLAKLAGTLSTVAISDPEPFSKAAAAALAITSAATAILANSESTAGFKSFILREEDSGSKVRIKVTDSGVEYHAHSGTDKHNPFKELGK